MISRTERSGSWDFERSSEYVRKQGLNEHIAFVSAKHRDKTLPLNSERHIYEIDNIVVRDLDIELDDRSAWDTIPDWSPLSGAKWHFERCRFRCPSPNMWALAFPWRGSFRFHKNESAFLPMDIVVVPGYSPSRLGAGCRLSETILRAKRFTRGAWPPRKGRTDQRTQAINSGGILAT